MAANDRAIVVGVQQYPLLGDLAGPENDANAFIEEWLTDPAGGAVPPANVKRILSSDFEKTVNPLDAEPTTGKLDRAFDELYALGDVGGGKAGRRLYIYLAGHGFAPTLEEAALLMANAARGRSGHYIGGRTYANWFRQSAFFDEVVLFMDCCRERSARAGIRPSPYDPLNAQTPARYLYGFATQWSRSSRERLVNGKVRGLFTLALLAGLRGEAPRDPAGQLTAETLSNFLYNRLPQIARENQVEPQDPELVYSMPNPIVFASPPAVAYHVRLTLPLADAGKPVELRNGHLQPVAGASASPVLWEWDVPPDTYEVRVAGAPRKVLELLGQGGPVDVSV